MVKNFEKRDFQNRSFLQRRSLAPSTTAKRLVDGSDYENDSDDYDDDDGLKRKGKRKRIEKPKKVIKLLFN